MGWNAVKAKGITNRWFFNVFGVILFILIGFNVAFGAVIFKYYYDSAEKYLEYRADSTANFFNKFILYDYPNFYAGTKKLIDDLSDKDKLELQILDADGLLIFTSSGFSLNTTINTSDVDSAKWGEMSSYIGKDGRTGEKIMAVSAGLLDENGNISGMARFSISLEEIDRQAWLIIFLTAGISLIVILLIWMSNYFFIRSIVRPVRIVSQTATKIAGGDLSVRIDKNFDDEIGELSDSINNMAQSLSDNEQLKNDFISSISHELRTPLTAIKGWSETMLGSDMQKDSATINRGLHVVNTETDRLSNMVEELLDFSRIQGGRMKLNMDLTDLGGVLENVSFIMGERAKREGLSLELEKPESEELLVLADSNRLNQVFINIVDNAIKHSEPGSKVQIKLTLKDERAVAEITDTGRGIPAEELPKVKDRFFKGSSPKRGSGLGLAIADEIIKLHGGDIEIESEEGKGTSVFVVLPILQK